jgi:hypothetical protein
MKLRKKKSKEDNKEQGAISLGSAAGKKAKWAENEVSSFSFSFFLKNKKEKTNLSARHRRID